MTTWPLLRRLSETPVSEQLCGAGLPAVATKAGALPTTLLSDGCGWMTFAQYDFPSGLSSKTNDHGKIF